jgi:precorrin-6Y C5,15-methyltransferase (decarboxylating)
MYMKLGIPDREFIRGQVPMTKQEVRILSVVKLQLDQTSVVYDVGAGTGSVSVELAGQCPQGKVYAIERNPEGINLLRSNIEKFHCSNVEVVEGTAPECLAALPAPTHAFIGGSGGNLVAILDAIREKNPQTRFVINAVTLETLQQITRLSNIYPKYKDMELVQINVAKGEPVGSYHMLRGENPVYICSFGGKEVMD